MAACRPHLRRPAHVAIAFGRFAPSHSSLPQEIEADLAILQVLADRRTLLLKRMRWAEYGTVLFGILMGLLGFQAKQAQVGPYALALMIAIGVWCALRLFRPRSLSTPWKVQSMSRILRRIFFAPGSPVALRADFGMGLHQLERKVHGSSWDQHGRLVTTNAATQFELQGTLVNGTNLTVSRVQVLFTSDRVDSAVQRTDQFLDTVVLAYPPQASPQPSQLGPTVTQYLRLGPGITLEVLDNRPGILALRSTRPFAVGAADTTALANLIAQTVALVDRSRQVVQLENESWPAYQPSSADLAGL